MKIYQFKNFFFKNVHQRFSTIFNPNSLMFQHKRDLDRIQKLKTRMRTPKNIEILALTEEMDFEPGIDYLGNNIVLKVCKNNSGNDKQSNSPGNGFIQLQVPFDKDLDLRRSYRLLHYERIRYGKLLEILDYISASTSYRFNNILPGSKQTTMVTASVDSIELFREVNLSNKLVINSYPTWTGESSLEIRIDIYNGPTNEKESELDSDSSFIGSASFVYVLRDAGSYSTKKKVIPLNLTSTEFENEDEKLKALLRQEMGIENKKVRLAKSHKSLFKSPPTQEESALLHEQFVTYRKNKDILIQQSLKGIDPFLCHIVGSTARPSNIKAITDTKVEKAVLMHSQNININGHIFGGYIMREALELGYVCAYLHSNKQNPSVISVDSVNFHKPVIVGSVAQFIAHVSLVHEELIHICVEVFNYVDTQDIPVLTTTINITYKTKIKTQNVFPTTYECGVKYLEAKRIIEKLFTIY